MVHAAEVSACLRNASLTTKRSCKGQAWCPCGVMSMDGCCWAWALSVWGWHRRLTRLTDTQLTVFPPFVIASQVIHALNFSFGFGISFFDTFLPYLGWFVTSQLNRESDEEAKHRLVASQCELSHRPGWAKATHVWNIEVDLKFR